ncbi:MAG: nucleotidyltransferase [Bacteroidetes bacterium]|nr:MAG: nucleotidyltransferase [Bacteroidota bacterium]
MNIVIPMAGRGSRLRPHTLTTPKPLIPVAGLPIVERLVEDIVRTLPVPVKKIAFITGRFGEGVEKDLLEVASRLGAEGMIRYQDEPLGTAHAILCGEECLEGPVVVAFADTLFRADFSIDPESDGVLFVQRIEDPSAFGVVVTDESGGIIDYVEKPQEFVGDLAMIGIYSFRDGARLKKELQYLIDNDVRLSGEYQLPDALRNMTKSGLTFTPGEVTEWMDCGNKAVTVETNRRVLDILQEENRLHNNTGIDISAQVTNSVIIPPCYIGPDVKIDRSIIGPHVSVGALSSISNSNISDSLIQGGTTIENSNIKESMIGAKASVLGSVQDLSIGDFCVVGTTKSDS